jgi:hypothetical protein
VYPSNIPWNHLLHYCLLPEADLPGRGENADTRHPPEASAGGTRQELAR